MTKVACFKLNGREVTLAGTDPTESLLRWLKSQRLTGTKEGCADGDCGACTVALVETGADGAVHYQAVNSCLLPMGFLPGRDVLTVEALADGPALHPVQQAMVDCAGSQCGYCTPGFVMSLFAGYYAHEFDDGVTEGNLCRCTGYRPIRAAAAQLSATVQHEDRFRARLATPRTALAAAELSKFYSPTDVDAALELKAAHPQAVWIAGATDTGVALSHGQDVASAFIALDRIAGFDDIDIGEDTVRLGAGVTLHALETRLAGVYPALDQMIPWFAARQVRNRATLGGNLGSASPIGDLLPVLLALEAHVVLRSQRGERRIAIDGYFLDYRKTERATDELIVAVELPRRIPGINASYKVAKRQTDDISIVAAVFVIERDAQSRVTYARLAFGGVAAIPRRAKNTEEFLIGKILDGDVVNATAVQLQQEFAPMSDHRASAGYRRDLCGGLFAKFVAEYLP
jgi:xanthine dehydrogenase small subunit